jgi:hypothetical protein
MVAFKGLVKVIGVVCGAGALLLVPPPLLDWNNITNNMIITSAIRIVIKVL